MTLQSIRYIVAHIKYKDWSIKVDRFKDGEMYLQVSFIGKDSETGAICEMKGRKWHISEHAVKSEIILTAFKAIQTAEEHEMREAFQYRGRAILGPHFDIERLVEICDQKAYEIRLRK